jgi:hypothetical protein
MGAPGYVALVLHAHLPYVRHPEHATPLEERWLHEALWETYLPLLDLLDRLENERISAPFTLSLSPTVAAMWRDPLLMARFEAHLGALGELHGREQRRAPHGPFAEVIAHYGRLLEAARAPRFSAPRRTSWLPSSVTRTRAASRSSRPAPPTRICRASRPSPGPCAPRSARDWLLFAPSRGAPHRASGCPSVPMIPASRRTSSPPE